MTKLDPVLLERIETASANEKNEVMEVMVALARVPDEVELEQLRTAGLKVRSTIGDIMTGSILLGKVSQLADSAIVIQIEASRPLYREPRSNETEA